MPKEFLHFFFSFGETVKTTKTVLNKNIDQAGDMKI